MIKIKDGDHYITTKWDVHDNYECSRCAYSTIYLEKMQKHWDESEKHQHIWGKGNAEVPATEAPKGPVY